MIKTNMTFQSITCLLLTMILFIGCKSKSNSTIIDQSIIDTARVLHNEVTHDTIIIISDFENYKNIEDIINYKDFKGKVLYFDIWSIYCGPCIKEFQISQELKMRYKSKPVSFIYLVDIMNTDEYLARWDSMINKYELYGYHIRMSKEFYNNINKIPGIRFIGKPHYIIVNKEGNIVFPNAERPSSKEKLYTQIDTLLL